MWIQKRKMHMGETSSQRAGARLTPPAGFQAPTRRPATRCAAGQSNKKSEEKCCTTLSLVQGLRGETSDSLYSNLVCNGFLRLSESAVCDTAGLRRITLGADAGLM